MEEILKDERFSHIRTDPRFRRIPKNVRKIKVDNRFKNVFKSKNFKERCHVDERGRDLDLEPSENLKKLYNLDKEFNENEEDSDKNKESNDVSQMSDNKVKKSKRNKKKNFNINEKNKEILFKVSDSEENSDELTASNKQKSQNKYLNNKNLKIKTGALKTLKVGKLEVKQEVNNKETDNNKAALNKLKSKKSALKNNDFNLKDSEVGLFDKVSKTKQRKKGKQVNIAVEQDSRFTQKIQFEEEEKEYSSSERNYVNISSNKDTVSKAEKDSRFKKKIEFEEKAESSSEEEYSDENDTHISPAKDIFSNDDDLEESEAESSSDEESEDSDSEDSDSDKADSFDHQWEEQHENAPDTDEITRRIAVCNMDWDRIRAIDLFAAFNSFKPSDSTIISVKIYPSEFGLKRMEEEKLKGPKELVEKTLASDEEEVEDKRGGKYNREKLRQYQMNRLKYYYAIVECDTPETANSLYDKLNGMEYESSSVRLDLRFVPDDMTFDQEPASIADNSCDLTDYKPRLFVTTALQQVQVGLTWDETDPHRRDIFQKAFTDKIDTIENDIKAYLASSSGESEDDENVPGEEGDLKPSTKERIQKYKALLQSITEEENEKNKEKYDMEITWETGVKEKTENLVKEKIEEKSYTPFEELQKKMKEKQKLKKKDKKIKSQQEEDSENSDSDESDSAEDTVDSKKKMSKSVDELYLISDSKKLDQSDKQSSKKKKKKKIKLEKKNTSEEVEVDINDPRFSAIYTSPLFNVDPSDPHFKGTAGDFAIIAEKQRRLKKKALDKVEEKITNKRFKNK